jgi:hypothetical protein
VADIHSVFENTWYDPFFGRSSFLTGTVGDILSFHILGQVIVVLNTAKAAKDLLERRGNVYPDRFAVPFIEMWVL